MDKTGYVAYLESLGNQNHYIGQIQKLIELERTLGIDLDDYIPFAGNYSKVDELDKILPEDMRYDEKLFFSINSYMRYRLSEFERKTSYPTDDSHPIESNFTFSGTKDELKTRLVTFMSENEADLFIEGFQGCAPNLGENESIEKSFTLDETMNSEPGMIHFLAGESNYNINIKALTLVAIALLLDIKITLGFASAALAIIGFNGQAIVRIDVSEGEKCLILEAIHSKNRIISADVFSDYNSECVHHDITCNYRREDKCAIGNKEIRRILDELCAKNIFRKIGNLYKYNF